ncbi:MAG: hypothetical protein ACFBZ9_08965 [Sphingomonadales bacterium]
MKPKSPAGPVFGYQTKPKGITKYGWRLLFTWAVLPLCLFLLLLDVIGYAIARFVFGSCYGVLCLIG